MDNEIIPDSQDESRRKYREERREAEEQREKIRMETKHRLKTDKAMQDYFKQYNATSIDNFIDSYANLKANYLQFGPKFGKSYERKNLRNYDEALNCLKQIQAKKMFDLRCQWGANLIKLEGVDITWDFMEWQEDIFNCPFLTPITQAEFDLFYQFATSNNFEYKDEEGIDFFEIINGDVSRPKNLSEWYIFHNTYTDSGKYLNLPDLRKEKERYYIKLCQKHKNPPSQNQNNEEKEDKETKKAIELPYLRGYVFKDVENFVKLFEDDKSKKSFYNFENYMQSLDHKPGTNDKYLTERAEEILEELTSVNVTLPIEANDDWRVGIINLWNKYQKDKVMAVLPLVYEEYCFKVENKIQVETIEKKYMEGMANIVKEQVLKGRELCGEPQNFDY